MHKKLTITLSEEVYEGLHRTIGRGNISRFIESLVRLHIVDADLEAGYKAMAADEDHEREAMQWVEGTLGDIDDEAW